MKRRRYTDEEAEFVRRHPLTPENIALFRDRFSFPEANHARLKDLRKHRKLYLIRRTPDGQEYVKEVGRPYAPEEIEFVRVNRMTDANVALFRELFDRPHATQKQLAGLRRDHKLKVVQKTHNKDGHVKFGDRSLHLHLWEQANGPVPKDMILRCIDGNRDNTDPSNWEAWSRSAKGHEMTLVKKIGKDQAMRPTIVLIAKLQAEAKRRAGKVGV